MKRRILTMALLFSLALQSTAMGENFNTDQNNPNVSDVAFKNQ